jgi:protein TonB
MHVSKLVCAAILLSVMLSAADARIVRMASVPEDKIARKVAPVYPPDALDHQVQGVVKIKVMIAPDGHVAQAHIVRGHPLLIQAALQAVRQWVFQPMGTENEPIRVATQVDVPFRLPANNTAVTK